MPAPPSTRGQFPPSTSAVNRSRSRQAVDRQNPLCRVWPAGRRTKSRLQCGWREKSCGERLENDGRILGRLALQPIKGRYDVSFVSEGMPLALAHAAKSITQRDSDRGMIPGVNATHETLDQMNPDV